MGRRIGITGGIGAGKSVVSRLLRLRGYKVYDCDTEAKRLMEGDEKLSEELRGILGNQAYIDGKLDRGYIAERIFNDSEIREAVNGCVHKAVRKDFLKFAEGSGEDVFVESAILATGGFLPLVDEVWLVDAPEELRIARVERRNGMTREKVMERIETQRGEFQMLPVEKTRRIENTDEASLLNETSALLASSDRL
ncbi:MAG: dephospho-CoA kinase [Muribaculaceae bacterium]|nr:dephospho-CoA kinase [Muribaculaceae bacterium]